MLFNKCALKLNRKKCIVFAVGLFGTIANLAIKDEKRRHLDGIFFTGLHAIYSLIVKRNVRYTILQSVELLRIYQYHLLTLGTSIYAQLVYTYIINIILYFTLYIYY